MVFATVGLGLTKFGIITSCLYIFVLYILTNLTVKFQMFSNISLTKYTFR